MSQANKPDRMTRRNTLFKPITIKAPMKLVLLSQGKKKRIYCDLCSHPARYACATCQVTYYCCNSHYLLDKEIHSFTCQKLGELRQPLNLAEYSEPAELQLGKKIALARIIMDYAQEFTGISMVEENYNSAIAAISLIDNLAKVYSDDILDRMKPLITMVECFLAKDEVVVAGKILARVKALAMKVNSLPLAVKALVSRCQGLFHLARKEREKAKNCFAEEVIQSCEEYGTDHIYSSSGFYNLAYTFFLQDDKIIAAHMLRKPVDIWIAALEPVIYEMVAVSHKTVLVGSIVTNKTIMPKSDLTLGLLMTKKIYNLFKEMEYTASATDLSSACYAWGCALYIAGKYNESKYRTKEGFSYLTSQTLKKDSIFKKLSDLVKFSNRKLSRTESQDTMFIPSN